MRLGRQSVDQAQSKPAASSSLREEAIRAPAEPEQAAKG